jgi:hypothetical protein
MEKHDEGGVGAELTRLLSGDNRKSRWLLGGIIGTAMVATWLACCTRTPWYLNLSACVGPRPPTVKS